MEYFIREAEIKDVKSLSELFIEFIETESNLEAMRRELELMSSDPNYFIAVACDKDDVIGTAMAIRCLDLVGNCNPFLLVENVVVSSQYRGKGIGKLLMKRIEEFGYKSNCNYITLLSGKNRGGAHEFYKSIGYSNDTQGFKKRLHKQH